MSYVYCGQIQLRYEEPKSRLSYYSDDEFYIEGKRRAKKRRLNPNYTHVYLKEDGTVVRDEDAIIFCQQLWKERAYAPENGVMFLRMKEKTRVGKEDEW